jgi:hypothetical protein
MARQDPNRKPRSPQRNNAGTPEQFSEDYRAIPWKPQEKRKGRLFIWVMILGLAGVISGVLIAQSKRSWKQLSADPPAEFLAARPEWDAQRREAEQRIAQAYWDCAVKVLQWHYPYGLSLPATPPEEFQIDAKTQPEPAAVNPGSRDFYWQRLREVWPRAWQEVHSWDLGWLSELLRPLLNKFTTTRKP